jgi:hypothetical protein
MNDANNAFAWGKRVMMSDDIEEQIFAEEDLLARFRQRYLTEYVFDGTEDDYHAQEEYAVSSLPAVLEEECRIAPCSALGEIRRRGMAGHSRDASSIQRIGSGL